jgi:hypothetical protein
MSADIALVTSEAHRPPVVFFAVPDQLTAFPIRLAGGSVVTPLLGGALDTTPHIPALLLTLEFSASALLLLGAGHRCGSPPIVREDTQLL